MFGPETFIKTNYLNKDVANFNQSGQKHGNMNDLLYFPSNFKVQSSESLLINFQPYFTKTTGVLSAIRFDEIILQAGKSAQTNKWILQDNYKQQVANFSKLSIQELRVLNDQYNSYLELNTSLQGQPPDTTFIGFATT